MNWLSELACVIGVKNVMRSTLLSSGWWCFYRHTMRGRGVGAAMRRGVFVVVFGGVIPRQLGQWLTVRGYSIQDFAELVMVSAATGRFENQSWQHA